MWLFPGIWCPPSPPLGMPAGRLFIDSRAGCLDRFHSRGALRPPYTSDANALRPERRTELPNALPIQMGGRLEVIGTEAGMHPAALLAPGTNDVAASRKPAQRGISAMPLSSCCSKPPTGGRLDCWLRRHRHTSDSPWNAQTQQERTGPYPIARLWGNFRVVNHPAVDLPCRCLLSLTLFSECFYGYP